MIQKGIVWDMDGHDVIDEGGRQRIGPAFSSLLCDSNAIVLMNSMFVKNVELTARGFCSFGREE